MIILSPFAPHLAEELWQSLGHQESIFTAKWPDYDKKLIIDEEVTVVVQINGKVRAEIKAARGASQKEIEKLINDLTNVKSHLQGKEIKKVIYLQDKLINLVVN